MLKNFRKFISQERLIIILIETVRLYSKLQFKWQFMIKYDLKFFNKNYESCHLCSSVKFKGSKIFAKSL